MELGIFIGIPSDSGRHLLFCTAPAEVIGQCQHEPLQPMEKCQGSSGEAHEGRGGQQEKRRGSTEEAPREAHGLTWPRGFHVAKEIYSLLHFQYVFVLKAISIPWKSESDIPSSASSIIFFVTVIFSHSLFCHSLAFMVNLCPQSGLYIFFHPGRKQRSRRSEKLKRRRQLGKPKNSPRKKLKANLNPRKGRKRTRTRMIKLLTTEICRELVVPSKMRILKCWNLEQTSPRHTGFNPSCQCQSSCSLSVRTRCHFWDWRKGPSKKSAPSGSDSGNMPVPKSHWQRNRRWKWSSGWTRLPRRAKPNLSVTPHTPQLCVTPQEQIMVIIMEWKCMMHGMAFNISAVWLWVTVTDFDVPLTVTGFDVSLILTLTLTVRDCDRVWCSFNCDRFWCFFDPTLTLTVSDRDRFWSWLVWLTDFYVSLILTHPDTDREGLWLILMFLWPWLIFMFPWLWLILMLLWYWHWNWPWATVTDCDWYR